MLALSSLEKSTGGRLPSKLALQPFLKFLYPQELRRHGRHAGGHAEPLPRVGGPADFLRRVPTQHSPAAAVDSWFVSSLVRAGQCRAHGARAKTRPPKVAVRRLSVNTPRHPFENHPVTKPPAAPSPLYKKEDLLALVDVYDGESFVAYPRLLEQPRQHHAEQTPALIVSDSPSDHRKADTIVWPCSGDGLAAVDRLTVALLDWYKDPDEIFQLYRQLPAPRIPYLRSSVRRQLLRHLAVVEKKDEHSMLRYLSVIDDMKAMGIPLTKGEWNSAISFAGRYVQKTSDAEVQAGLHLWREMERSALVKGTQATFNILFDLATKAGKFRLAEMIYMEMQKRGLEFNRFHYVSLIHHCGLQGDGIGARNAYKELVTANEIVDVVVLNSLISALVRSNEPEAAFNIYERIKSSYSELTGREMSHRNYRERRTIDRSLIKFGADGKRDPSLRDFHQRNTYICPNIQTYRPLITYYAVQAGDLTRVVKLLDDMRSLEIPPHGVIFRVLFKGFTRHGGIRYSQWTLDRLESVWSAFVNSFDDGNFSIEAWVAIWALRAIFTLGGKERAMEAWTELQAKWKPDQDVADLVVDQSPDFYSTYPTDQPTYKYDDNL